MKSVLVTGGSKRLGAIVAETLASAGWRVAVSSHRPDSGADLIADLSRPDGAENLFAAAVSLFGGSPPSAIVNNAAVFRGSVEEIETLNFKSPARLVELLAENTAGDACAVNILDAAVLGGAVVPGVYGDAKSRLAEYTLSAAERFAGRLRVNGVAPGAVLPPEGFHLKAPPHPFGRPDPKAVAEATLFLLSAKWTTGCIIPVA